MVDNKLWFWWKKFLEKIIVAVDKVDFILRENEEEVLKEFIIVFR